MMLSDYFRTPFFTRPVTAENFLEAFVVATVLSAVPLLLFFHAVFVCCKKPKVLAPDGAVSATKPALNTEPCTAKDAENDMAKLEMDAALRAKQEREEEEAKRACDAEIEAARKAQEKRKADGANKVKSKVAMPTLMPTAMPKPVIMVPPPPPFKPKMPAPPPPPIATPAAAPLPAPAAPPPGAGAAAAPPPPPGVAAAPSPPVAVAPPKPVADATATKSKESVVKKTEENKKKSEKEKTIDANSKPKTLKTPITAVPKVVPLKEKLAPAPAAPQKPKAPAPVVKEPPAKAKVEEKPKTPVTALPADGATVMMGVGIAQSQYIPGAANLPADAAMSMYIPKKK